MGYTLFYHDNWTGLADLYTIIGDDFKWDDNHQNVRDLAKDGE